MKMYVLKFDDNEYVESFDFESKKVTVTDDKNEAEHIYSESTASFLAERFG